VSRIGRGLGEGWGWRGGEVDAVERRLDRALRRLEELVRLSPLEAAVMEGPRVVVVRRCCALRPPAAPEAISDAELRLGATLPEDYSRFLRRSNGAILFADAGESEGTATGAELYGAEALVRHAEELEAQFPGGPAAEVVVFGAVGLEGDRLAFESMRRDPFGGCAVLNGRRGWQPDRWWVIARDFTSWLEAVLRETAAHRSFGRNWHEESEQPLLPLPVEDDLSG
jgi:hypothetical protein